MNYIAKSARIAKSATLGVGNIIGEHVIIHENVQLGCNNRIYPRAILYANTLVGSENVILEDSRIGENPTNMNYVYKRQYDGVTMANRNVINRQAVLESGTTLGDENRVAHGSLVGHNVTITNHVHIYSNTAVGGYSTFLPYSGIGMNASLHQNRVVGSYSFIGLGCAQTRHVFPHFIHVQNRITRMNSKRLPSHYLGYECDLASLQSLCSKEIPENIEILLDVFPSDIQGELLAYFNAVRKMSE